MTTAAWQPANVRYRIGQILCARFKRADAAERARILHLLQPPRPMGPTEWREWSEWMESIIGVANADADDHSQSVKTPRTFDRSAILADFDE